MNSFRVFELSPDFVRHRINDVTILRGHFLTFCLAQLFWITFLVKALRMILHKVFEILLLILEYPDHSYDFVYSSIVSTLWFISRTTWKNAYSFWSEKGWSCIDAWNERHELHDSSKLFVLHKLTSFDFFVYFKCTRWKPN